MIDRRAVRQALVVARKELRDSCRDRRATWSIVVSVLVAPVMVGFMMNRVAERQREAEEVRIPVVGAEHAPALVDWLARQSGVAIAPPPADPEAAVRGQDEAVVLVIPPEFAERFRASRPAPVRIVGDASRRTARPSVERVRRLLQAYAAEISTLRLIARGVSPTAALPLEVEDVEVSTAQARAAQILSFIPMFIILSGFIGSMQIATDSTAGERERGSLEPLLVNPAPRGALVTGKWLAASAAGLVTVTLTTALWVAMPRVLPLEDMGIRFRLGPEHAGSILAAVAPLSFFWAALQASVATLAKSFKEAQSYMGVLTLAPMIPPLVGALYPIGSAPWMAVVPMLGPSVVLTDIIGGRPVHLASFAAVAAVSIGGAVILVQITTWLFRSERVILGR
jgi:sodium transport system permease protein